jgi:aryl-alcohol dehydrogenase-like predicted oxidoreductase
MKYRKLGRTNFNVSEIGHGLWGMSGWSGSEDQRSLETLQLAVDRGCNFLDSAWAYGDGRSDRLLGQTLRANAKKRLYAASKVPPKNRQWPAQGTLAETFPLDHVLEHAEKSRAKIGADTIDLLQYHVWDDSWTDDPAFRNSVEALKNKELIHSFGLSLNRWEPWNGLKALRTGLVDSVQVIYNIFDQAPEDELFPACRELNVGVIARVPLDEGGLGGKLTLETRFPEKDWRAGYFNAENLKATVERAERLKRLLPKGMTLPEMALRFVLSNHDVSTTIVGMRDAAHVRQNTACSDAGPLQADLLQELKHHRWDRKPTRWSA